MGLNLRRVFSVIVQYMVPNEVNGFIENMVPLSRDLASVKDSRWIQ